jgi:prevent-host-death family protein
VFGGLINQSLAVLATPLPWFTKAQSWHTQPELVTFLAQPLDRKTWKIIADNMYYTYNPHMENSPKSYMSIDDAVTVSAAEFHRNVGVYQDIALTKPVTITKNGRERTVLLSAQEYARLKRRDRRVIAAGELSERQVDAIRNARVPDQYAELDKEIKD